MKYIKMKFLEKLKKSFSFSRNAFTFSELIITISILSILLVITFIYVNSLIKVSRDLSRAEDLNRMSQSLDLVYPKSGKYPNPSNGVNITFSGAKLWTQGTFGNSVIENIAVLNKKPIDVLTKSEYTYSITAKGTEYEIGTILEGNNLSGQNIVSKTYANGEVIARSMVLGNYNGKVISVSTGSIDYVLALPTIISYDINEADIIKVIDKQTLSYKGYNNLPSSYSGTIFKIDGGFDFNPEIFVVYNGKIKDLSIDESKRMEFLSNLQSAYSGTVLSSEYDYQNLISNPVDEINSSKKIIDLVLNVLKNEIGFNIPISISKIEKETLSGATSSGTKSIYKYILDKEVYDITEDDIGNMWFATKLGVVKFDGFNWILFNEGDGLIDKDTTGIMQDDNGNIWVSTKKGISKFDGSNWILFNEGDGLIDKDTTGIMQDNNGNIWVSTKKGISKYDGISWISFDEGDGLIDKEVRGLLQDDNGNMWFATLKGVSKFDGSNWTSFDESDGLLDKNSYGLLQDDNGDMWFTTLKGVSRFDGFNWISYDETDGLIDKNVIGIMKDNTGNIWFSTKKGASMFDGTNWTSYDESDGISDKEVNVVFQDSNSDMRFGTKKGVSLFNY